MEISNYQFLSLLHLNNMKMNRGTIIISKDSNFWHKNTELNLYEDEISRLEDN